MPKAIQILTTLEYLGPYADGTYFGLVLQVGIAEAGVPQDVQVTLAMKQLFEPWEWKSATTANKSPDVKLWMYQVSDSNPPDPKDAKSSQDDPVAVNLASYSLDPSITAALEHACEEAIPAHLEWIDAGSTTGNKTSQANPDSNRYPWPAHLAQVSQYPYPIPHLLNLSFLLKVSDPDFAHPKAGFAYFATVAFKADVGGVTKTYTPQVNSSAALNSDKTRLTILYDDPSLATCTQPLTLFVPAATVLANTSATSETTDWQAHLVPGCADVFDLSSRLIGSVRNECQQASPVATCTDLQKAVAKNFDVYVTAVLTAERDLIAYGCLTGPDGSSLVTRLGSLWTAEATDITNDKQKRRIFVDQFSRAVINRRTIESSDQLAFQIRWQAALQKTPVFANNPLVLRAPGSSPRPIDVEHLSHRLTELEHLHLQLTQSNVLSQLLLFQWEIVANGYHAATPPPGVTSPLPDKEYNQLFQSFRASAAANMSVLNVRGLLSQGNLQESWVRITSVTSGSKGRDDLRANIPAELDTRLGDLLKALPGVQQPPDFSTPLRAAVRSWATNLQDTLVPNPVKTDSTKKQSTAVTQPTRTTEGLSILLEQISAASSSADDAQDNLRQMSGLCVLMREKTENVWRCLNAANLLTTPRAPQNSPPPDPIPAVKGLTGPIVVPVPQHTQDNLRRAILTYNNQPLMGESPAHAFSKDLVPSQEALHARLVSFQHPSVTELLDNDAKWKIPGLAFNRKYDFLIGRVSNAGALPRPFADPKLGPAALNFEVTKKVRSLTLSGVSYMRTVPVSDLRFGPTGGSLDKIALPAIPADVHPRSREAGLVCNLNENQACPLLLLSSYKVPKAVRSFALDIYKPTTDLLTWDRWMAAKDTEKPGTDSGIRKLRTQVWNRYHVCARQESSKNLTSLDDPAVRTLTIKIEGVEGLSDKDGTDTKTWLAPLTQPDPNPLLNRVLTPAAPLTLAINAVDAVFTGKIFDSATWTLNLKPGVVAKIKLTPGIETPDLALFGSGILPADLSSYTFLVETASAELPGIDDLFAALKIIGPNSSSQKTVDFTLTLKNAPNVRGADLQTQIWRWDGRPSAQYPFSENTDAPGTTLLAWELETFGTRLASDSTIRAMARGQGDSGTVVFEAHDDRGTEPGATYYRAAVTAYNRYGSLVPKDSQSRSTLNDFASVPGAIGGWKRRFIAANFQDSYIPPKPAIKFIVPLTGSTTDSHLHAASVLVVLQGPWYAMGGLAEDLSAHIVDSSEQDDAEKVKEAGPDPIIFAGKRSELPPDYRDFGGLYPEAFLHGPIGHTFDSSDDNPLWVSSSFVLDPPVDSTGKVAQEGTFAKVQFARVIHKEGVIGNITKDLISKYTDPVWIQFLPSRFVGIQDKDLSAGLTLEVMANKATIKRKDGTPVMLSHNLNTGLNTDHYVFALLVTEEVTDLLGRKGQERFIDVLLQPATDAADPSTASWNANSLGNQANFIGRILLIHRQANTTACKSHACALSNADSLWNELFPPPGSEDVDEISQDDVISRIVSISPPIYTSPSISCNVNMGDSK